MKKKHVFAILFVFAFSITAKAQIENEIKNYVDSTEILLNNGRKFLSKSIQDGNLKKSQEVFHYLMMKGEERNCWSFSYKEQLLLNIAFKDVSATLRLIENYSDESVYLCYRNMEPVEDAVYAEFRKNKPRLENLKTSDALEGDDRAILGILFYILENDTQSEQYNVLISDFKKKYPQSKYNKFVKNYLPTPKTKSSISYFLGSKFNFFSGNLSKYFNNSPTVAFSMDFCISKLYISMYMEGANLKILRPVTLTNKTGESHDFEAGDWFNKMDIGFKTGYYLIRNKHIHIAPYATLLAGGFMESTLYTTESDSNKEFSIYDSFTPGLGVNFEYKLGGYKSKTAAPYMYGFENLGYFSLKLDAGFVTIPGFKYLPAKGDAAYITLGLVWGIGEF